MELSMRWKSCLLLIVLAGLLMVPPALCGTPEISLQDLDGGSHSLEELRAGKPTVLIFWATWCGHCRAEIPKIREAWEKYGGAGISFLAVDPGVRDSLATVGRYVEKFSIPYPVYFDPHQQSRTAFGLRGTPTIILLDAEGKEISRSESIRLEDIAGLLKD